MNKNDFILPAVLIAVAIALVGGFIGIKKYKDSTTPAPVAIVEAPAEEPAEEPAVEEPAPEKKKRAKRDAASTFTSISPIGMDSQIQEMPTKEEVIDYAYEMLDYYRNYTEEEKMQMQMAMGVMQYYMEAMRMNIAEYVQQLDFDQRMQLAQVADESRELLDALQVEMSRAATDEEISVFGGAFQSMQALNDSLIDAAIF